MIRLQAVFALTVSLLSAVTAVWAAAPDGARALFARYQALERSFDPQLADLYADQAVILVTRKYSNGVVRRLKIPGDLYRQALRDSMPEAAQRGDYNQYRGIAFTPRDGAVEVTAQRYNAWREYSSPYRALLRRDDGGWKIIEEHFDTRLPYPATE